MEAQKPLIVLGVSGGIAAYKSAEVVRRLIERGAAVQVVMTRGAREFVAPLTFAVLSGREVYTEVWGDRDHPDRPTVDHVELADRARLLLVAPATAHTMAKFAHGLADDFLSTYYLAHHGPVLLAPAMETRMWEKAAVARNRERLAADGVRFVGPGSGFLASGHSGMGRMSEPAEIVEEAWALATGARRDLAGMSLLVTAGPTRERIDPIRFVSNRSSGRMGYALAEAARDRGAKVTLLSGATSLPRPSGIRVRDFESAADLMRLLIEEFPGCDALAMAAAVADFVPEESRERLHRAEGPRSLRLQPGDDLLATIARLKKGQTVVAFAAETEDVEARAAKKMEQKNADLIVANDVGKPGIGFDSAENEITILHRDGTRRHVTRRSKRAAADAVWDEVLAARTRAALPKI
ncbi:MAG TPA: bifunctional phosphopantothenoylcysteine decarboxylase/phosphopantothenate--cysteine ligase CoaBC [Thermoanaerobaculia bacterium]|jgi:phosphopantothenoylcysteine decarboxylase/phosphopantothenate--cysteine ligase